MTTEQLFLIGFNILLALVTTFGGLWIKSLQAYQNQSREEIKELYNENKELREKFGDYALREDARRQDDLVNQKLDRIDHKIDLFVDRLSGKVDKT